MPDIKVLNSKIRQQLFLGPSHVQIDELFWPGEFHIEMRGKLIILLW